MPGTVELITYNDVLLHMVNFAKGNPSAEYYRDARQAVLSAYREFANSAQWTYYTSVGRINTSAPYETGTIAYDHTGGSSERIVTLTDGTWPDWATYGILVIDSTPYEIAERLSDTTLTLTATSNPGADVAAETAYTIYRDTYPMPADFISADEMVTANVWRRMRYVHPRQWLMSHRFNVTSSNTPNFYTFRSDPNYYGVIACSFYPYPDDDIAIDFIYQRRPRGLTIEDYHAGTVTCSAGSDTISGAMTAFSDSHVGSVIRLSDDAVDTPTGRTGANPFTIERTVMSVTDATTITVDRVVNDSLSGVKYLISDPLDLEPGVMTNAFLRCCENQMAMIRRLEDRGEIMQLWKMALIEAREHDSRAREMRSVGGTIGFYNRLADMPGYPELDDVE